MSTGVKPASLIIKSIVCTTESRRLSLSNYIVNMMMMMMKLPILPCAEKLELVLSTAPKT